MSPADKLAGFDIELTFRDTIILTLLTDQKPSGLRSSGAIAHLPGRLYILFKNHPVATPARRKKPREWLPTQPASPHLWQMPSMLAVCFPPSLSQSSTPCRRRAYGQSSSRCWHSLWLMTRVGSGHRNFRRSHVTDNLSLQSAMSGRRAQLLDHHGRCHLLGHSSSP